MLLLASAGMVVALAGCSGISSGSSEKVWCVGPGEVVDDQFKQEYPELYMTRAECDAAKKAFGE